MAHLEESIGSAPFVSWRGKVRVVGVRPVASDESWRLRVHRNPMLTETGVWVSEFWFENPHAFQ